MNNAAFINKNCCIDTKIGVTPDITIGDVQSFCVGKPRLERNTNCKKECSYMVNQMLCVRFPLNFSAKATVISSGCSKNCKPHREQKSNHNQRYNQCRIKRTIMCILFCFLPFCCGAKIGCRAFS
jgi:hypothetical protein